MIRLHGTLCAVAAAVASCAVSSRANAAPTIWAGPPLSFSKPAFASPALVHDYLTDQVRLARGNSQGLYNIAAENLFSGTSVSPVRTEWATDLINPGQTIDATNWAALSFTNWTAAYGGAVGTNFDRDAVVHLITDDVYLNLRFTAWAGGNTGGAYAYTRSTPVPEPAATMLAIGSLGVALCRRRVEGTLRRQAIV
jgi:hypothetical protein